MTSPEEAAMLAARIVVEHDLGIVLVVTRDGQPGAANQVPLSTGAFADILIKCASQLRMGRTSPTLLVKDRSKEEGL